MPTPFDDVKHIIDMGWQDYLHSLSADALLDALRTELRFLGHDASAPPTGTFPPVTTSGLAAIRIQWMNGEE